MTPFSARLVRRSAVACLAAAVSLAPVAAAQDPPVDVAPATGAALDPDDAGAAPPPASKSTMEVDLIAGVWLARLNGDSRLGAGPGVGDVDVADGLDLDGSEANFNAELTVRFLDRWMVRGSGYQFSTDDAGRYAGGPVRYGDLVLLPGDPYDSSFDIDSYAAEVGYDVWRPLNDDLADLRVTIFGGVRYLEVEQTLGAPGLPPQKGDGDWVALYVGGEFDMHVRARTGIFAGRDFGIGVGVGAGLDVTGEIGPYAQIRGGLSVELIRHVSLNVGYRLLYADFEDGDFTFTGGLRGLFVGGQVRF